MSVFFKDEQNINYKLFESLPILPEHGIKIKELSKKLGITPNKARAIISTLPPNAPVYEDFGEIGRII